MPLERVDFAQEDKRSTHSEKSTHEWAALDFCTCKIYPNREEAVGKTRRGGGRVTEDTCVL